jgi:hypothetical protein
MCGAGGGLGGLLHTALPNVAHLELWALGLADLGQLPALAVGLSKVESVSIHFASGDEVADPDGQGVAVKALACALSEQQQGGGGSRSSGSLPCVRVEVADVDTHGAKPMWPLSRQRREHPGVEVWQV